MRALHARQSGNQVAAVSEALANDPDAATQPFFDHAVEPPLCYAVRSGCDKEVIGVLINHGADVNAADTCGQTPLALLCSTYCQAASPNAMHAWVQPSLQFIEGRASCPNKKYRKIISSFIQCAWESSSSWGYSDLSSNQAELCKHNVLTVAAELLQAGADPMDMIRTDDGKRSTCLEYVGSTNNSLLFQLLEAHCMA
jgi:hypothetical protein